ncbi:short-chain dehydrogenase/reductase [Pseudovirgaria hyperparasitica]|uniref:Short-chain dehydrogenase/reductase n=1 Tax=Pseudovirgaria hyperparasitica TaxID=470096 RepID=A0A6A6WC42_9PEZI|nr:short-chain dehydrogenase/reductase [Pseudovirgaria hyperparasitica]KAF2760273.1 short-chain dehydrogenase/reductase [Pseudovirgaria hyperparasitica]
MVHIKAIRAANAELKSLGPGLVAVFVGGTSGIGETTAREFVRQTDSPRVYLIGRNQTQGTNLISEFKTINTKATVNFIQADVSLLKNVDAACAEVTSQESHLNLLFLSPGLLTMRGRTETAEGLDAKFALHYYARLRFVTNLLPLLQSAPEPQKLSRVISVLAAGLETSLNMADLQLKNAYTLKACADHATTMTSLSLRRLARQYPTTSFIHSAPGGVRTNIARDMNPLMRLGMNLVTRLPLPMIVSLRDSGDRHLYAATNAAFKADGKAHLIGWSNEPSANETVLQEQEGSGISEEVWKHTEEVFEKVQNEGKYDS